MKSMPKPRNCRTRQPSVSLMLLLTLLLASCATSSVATKPPRAPDPLCAALQPILVGNQDVLTDETARQILAYDQAYQRLCKPGSTPRK